MMIGLSMKRFACAVSMAFLAACGGGGGGGGTSDDAATAVDVDEASVILSVAMYDSLAGLRRMLKLEGYSRIKGAAPLATTACPGGGSIQTEKVGSIFTLVANNCQLLSTDGLVYNGTWVLTIGSNSYAADGSCAGTCQFFASINHAAGRFGYGAATEPVVGSGFQIEFDIVETDQIFTMGEAFSDVPGVKISGNVRDDGASPASSLSLFETGPNFFTISGTDERKSLLVSGLLSANVVIGPAGLTATIDKDMNGTFEKTLVIPWSRLQE